MKQSVLIAKGTDEHERYFKAFLERRAIRQQTEDMFGTTREVEAEVHSVEHAGDKTRFTLVPKKAS